MSITFKYKGETFTAQNRSQSEMVIEKALVAEMLSADSFSFLLRGATGNYEQNYRKGDVLEIWNGASQIAEFFIERIKADDANFQFTCTSAVGMLATVHQDGGMLSGETVGDVLPGLMGNYSYVVDPEVAAIQLRGWLPESDCRSALRQICLPYGISIMRTSAGLPHFKFNFPTVAKEISRRDVYSGLKRGDLTPVTQVTVLEHSFYASNAVSEEVLFDNTSTAIAASSDRISFDMPIQATTLRATGSLTIDDSGVNFAVVSGVGVLYGKPYVHTVRAQSASTGVVGEPNEMRFEDAYLVNSLNSYNTLQRLASYYSTAEELDVSIRADGTVRAGDLVRVYDKYRQEWVNGYLQKAVVRFSASTTRADCSVIANWRPDYIGNNYDSYVVIKASDLVGGVWTVPAELQGKRVQVVLFGGLRGGHSGGKGQTPAPVYPGDGTWHYEGNAGGVGGDGGEGAMVYAAEIDLTAASYAVTIGSGGPGGISADGTDVAGDLGGDTTFGSMSSANGAEVSNYINLVDGTLYIEAGDKGQDGGKGGEGGTVNIEMVSYITPDNVWDPYLEGTWDVGEDGEDIGTHSGGAKGTTGWVGQSTGGQGVMSHGKTVGVTAPGGGGGASISANGSAGGNSTSSYNAGVWSYFSGPGGNGAAATTVPAKASFGKCGRGGYGGGGGGLPGKCETQSIEWPRYSYNVNPGTPGQGGLGSQGGTGSDGFVVVYYKA